MCGIFGCLNKKSNQIDRNKIIKMGDSIKHRGPDDDGIYFDEKVAIGNQRLSIIDLEQGRQPFISDDGNIVVVQNGEIYNYVELAKELSGTPNYCRSKSDTEVILRLYEQHGINFVSKLNGMFAIAIWDRNHRILHLIRDRVGVKPLYLYEDHEHLYFGSEIKAILAADLPKKLNFDALNHFFAFNYVPPPYTLFADIKHLPPGHRLEVSANNTKMVKWWTLENTALIYKSEAEWIDEFNFLMSDAVKIRMRAEVPFGAFLSGGVDSSTVVGFMTKYQQNPIKTFSIGFEDPLYDETVFANKAVERFKTEHYLNIVNDNILQDWQKTIYFCDQPHGDVSFIPTYVLSELASKHVKMVLTGDGGDELFAGYDKYKNFFQSSVVFDTEDKQRNYFDSIGLFNTQQRKELFTNFAWSNIKEHDSFQLVRQLFSQSSHLGSLNQALYIDTQLLLSGNNLVKPDRMGMAFGLEARTPFLDYRMLEYAFSMPGNLKLSNGETKFILKKAVSPIIGRKLAYRKKQMFTVPIGDWFKEEKFENIFEEIRKNPLLNSIINMNVLNKYVDFHITNRKNYTRELRAIIALHFWQQVFDV